MALAVAQILVPQLGRPALMAWFAWLGFLILDRIPNGRPPAWDAGEAIPYFQRAISQTPASAVYVYHLGAAYIEAGNSVEGHRALERAFVVLVNL